MNVDVELKSRSEIRALTGLRGLAAIFVVAFHASGQLVGTDPATNFLRHGYNAVDLFFVLSGFVMALTYGAEFAAGGTKSRYFSFLGRRIARIYPLYAISTLFALAISQAHFSGTGPIPNPVRTLVLNLMGIQSWGFTESIVGPAWSISTEWGAYLIFPVLVYFALLQSSVRPLLLAIVALICLSLLAYLPDRYVLGYQTERLGPLDLYLTGTVAPLLRCIASFSIGMIAYRWRQWFRSSYSLPLAFALVLVCLFPRTDVLFVLICAALIPSLFSDTGIVARALGSVPIYYLGLWSYSIYIVHVRFNPIRSGAERALTKLHVPMAPQFAVIIVILAVVMCAACTYRYIEIPARSMLRRLLSQRRGRAMKDEPAAP